MKKLSFLVACAVLFASNAVSQSFTTIEEPEFVGETVVINSDSTVIPLEKHLAKITTRANAGIYIVGIGKIRQRIEIEGNASSIRLKQGDKHFFAIRGIDNLSDPLSIISFFKFEVTKKTRRAELSSTATFSGASSGNLDHIPFVGKKFKESSYLLKTGKLEAGEYGIIVSNPNARDEKNMVVATFGVD
ncbi:MAG: hypothetical protein EOL95_00510 [Bacteroidia bacterium]|nr:hypothetical protein [Bacteroidia bacterium]